MSYTSKIKPSTDDGVVYAYEPNLSLQKIIGAASVADIFTKEKIEACQKLLDDAKSSFFDTAKDDMCTITALVSNKALVDNFEQLCSQLFEPVSNIKGQANIFGFPLISCICKYLLEYCADGTSGAPVTARDVFIINRLVEALDRAFSEKIVDAGGAIEKELIAVIEQARKVG
jgi:hypothetical protein